MKESLGGESWWTPNLAVCGAVGVLMSLVGQVVFYKPHRGYRRILGRVRGSF